MSEPVPPAEWAGRIGAREGGEVAHTFPPRPEVVQVGGTEGAQETAGHAPESVPVHPEPEPVRPQRQEPRPMWRRPPGQRDDLGEPSG